MKVQVHSTLHSRRGIYEHVSACMVSKGSRRGKEEGRESRHVCVVNVSPFNGICHGYNVYIYVVKLLLSYIVPYKLMFYLVCFSQYYCGSCVGIQVVSFLICVSACVSVHTSLYR